MQGYKDGAVNYSTATHLAGGTALVTANKDFLFIKNTGFKFSSATVLGLSTTDIVLVVIQEVAHNTGVDGGYQTGGDADQIHFYEVAWLKPGQAVIIPCGAVKNSITQFGSNANDLSQIGENGQNGQAKIYVRTFLSNGSAASSGNAVEYLAVS